MTYGEKGDNSKHKFLALTLTIIIIGLIVLSGPANAFLLDLGISKDNVKKGETVNFSISIDAETNEFSNINNLTLVLNGPSKFECKFYANTTIISGCNGIIISLINHELYGYGYGYDKSLSYNITLNTSQYPIGTYSTKLTVFTDSKSFTKTGTNLTISSGGSSQNIDINGCSIRAKNGDIYVNGSLFGTNIKLNMNFKNAGKGQGSITSQAQKSRFAYTFKTKDVLAVNGSNFQVEASGYYKLNKTKFDSEDAIFYIDVKNKKMDVVGENFVINDMDITFSTKCNKITAG
ncbi:MAG: hypothetical protein WCX73_01915 [Candidatus Pacearchaeota archaeon]|jgi:hypothetical protein